MAAITTAVPDTSPVPKKDWMGMDYIPVYEGEQQDDGNTVKVSPGRSRAP
jgi:Cu(I)/Ag(I) efflux system membrane fusion protein